jgi:acyl-CoA dehydrogenase
MSGRETSQMMVDGLSRVLAGFTDATTLAKIEKGSFDPAHQAQIDGLGFDIALVAEEQDGAGLGWADVSRVFETLGFFAAPVDLGEQIIARWAMAAAQIPMPDNCPAVAVNPVSVDDQGRAYGTLMVPWLKNDQPVLAESVDGTQLCLIAADQLGKSVVADTVGRIPTRQVELSGATIDATGVLAGEICLRHANAFLRSSYISGALAAVLEITIEHCNTRAQFGRPIAKFQAIQQLVAQLAGETAAANAAVRLAGAGVDSGRGAMEIAVTKHRTSAAVAPVAAIAHEVHGAIGTTDEHILHYYTRRLWQWREEAGSEHVWAEQIGREIITAGRDKLWPKLLGLTEGTP